MSKSIRVTDSH